MSLKKEMVIEMSVLSEWLPEQTMKSTSTVSSVCVHSSSSLLKCSVCSTFLRYAAEGEGGYFFLSGK